MTSSVDLEEGEEASFVLHTEQGDITRPALCLHPNPIEPVPG